MWSGVRKSGWPMPRLMIDLPLASKALARASTSKAVSVPSAFMRAARARLILRRVLREGGRHHSGGGGRAKHGRSKPTRRWHLRHGAAEINDYKRQPEGVVMAASERRNRRSGRGR